MSGVHVTPPADAPLQEERRATLELLRAVYLGVPARELAGRIVVLARAYSDCEAAAIRLQEGPDFPYAAQLGFDPEHICRESRLCAVDGAGAVLRNGDHWPVLECLCGAVLARRAGGPGCTAAGSFVLPSDQGPGALDLPERFRGHCLDSGYRSVGLFPIREGPRTFGLIQCCDRRPGRLPAGRIELLEALAATAAHLFQLSSL